MKSGFLHQSMELCKLRGIAVHLYHLNPFLLQNRVERCKIAQLVHAISSSVLCKHEPFLYRSTYTEPEMVPSMLALRVLNR